MKKSKKTIIYFKYKKNIEGVEEKKKSREKSTSARGVDRSIVRLDAGQHVQQHRFILQTIDVILHNIDQINQ
jgi:hypothetical protein